MAMVLWDHITNITGINAYKLWINATSNFGSSHLSKRRFLLALGNELTKELIVFRYSNNMNLQTRVKECFLKLILKLQALAAAKNPPKGTVGRCYLCKQNKDRKSSDGDIDEVTSVMSNFKAESIINPLLVQLEKMMCQVHQLMM